MENLEEESAKFSFKDFLRMIFKRKWLFLAITAGVFILGATFMEALYNPSITEYSAYFSIEYPNDDKGQYPNGEVFKYQDIISAEQLEEVKKSDAKFKNIDVARMSAYDMISIVSNKVIRENAKDPSSLDVNVLTYDYKITVKALYFSDDETAASFLQAVATAPVNYAKESVKEAVFDSYISAYGIAPTFEEKLEALANQTNYMLGKYDEFINDYKANFVVNGKTLETYKQELTVLYGSSVQKDLDNDLKNGGFIFNTEDLVEDNARLISEYNSNKIIVDDLVAKFKELVSTEPDSTSSVITTAVPEIYGYTKRNSEIKIILQGRGYTYNQTDDTFAAPADYHEFLDDSKAFAAKLDGYRAVLSEQAEICKQVSVAVYGSQSKITVAGNRVIRSGEVSLVITSFVSLIVGVLIAVAVICIIELPKRLSPKKAANVAGEGSGEEIAEQKDEDQKTAEPQAEENAETQPEEQVETEPEEAETTEKTDK